MTMKNLSLFLLLILVAGCHGEMTGIPRLEAFGDSYEGYHRGEAVPDRGSVPLDTVLYMTAVEFPEGYDWRRDTSYGEVSGRIVLYRDSVRILEVPAGPGCIAAMDPDLHHLAYGHLYTESVTDDETVIGRDGELLFSYPGREILCGLLVEGEEVYTLGRDRSGSGFALRRNGEEVFSYPKGGITAHFSARPDYPSGALYRDGGHMYFSYWRPAGKERSWFIVEDCEEHRVDVPDGGVYDIRVRDGMPDIRVVKSSPLGVYTYAEDTWKAVVAVSSKGRLTVYTPLWPTSRYIPDPVLFVSFRDACVFGERLYMAMNPLAEGEKPFLWCNEEVLYSLDINGFITEVSVILEERSGGG